MTSKVIAVTGASRGIGAAIARDRDRNRRRAELERDARLAEPERRRACQVRLHDRDAVDEREVRTGPGDEHQNGIQSSPGNCERQALNVPNVIAFGIVEHEHDGADGIDLVAVSRTGFFRQRVEDFLRIDLRLFLRILSAAF